MNETLFFTLNSLAGRYAIMDSFMIFSSSILVLVIFLGTIIFLAKAGRRALLAFLVTVILVAFFDRLINLLWPQDRPFVAHTVNLLTPHSADSSFPSLHTAFASASAISVFFHKKLIGTMLVVGAFFVGIGRIFVGVHWPIDVLGGFLIGGLSAYGVKILAGRVKSFNFPFVRSKT